MDLESVKILCGAPHVMKKYMLYAKVMYPTLEKLLQQVKPLHVVVCDVGGLKWENRKKVQTKGVRL